MSLLWINPLLGREPDDQPDERRVRAFVQGPGSVSESVASLSAKLGIRSSRLRRILNQLVQEGLVERRDFADIEPLYVRYPTR
jgi:predicted ArsR family transcriptional regulator